MEHLIALLPNTSKKNLKMAEIMVLNALGWRMEVITPSHFIETFLGVWSQWNEDLMVIKDLLDITLRHGAFAEYRPSVIAATILKPFNFDIQFDVDENEIEKCRVCISGMIF